MPAAELVEPPSFRKRGAQGIGCAPTLFCLKLDSRICCVGAAPMGARPTELSVLVRPREQAGFCVTCPIAPASWLALAPLRAAHPFDGMDASQSAAGALASLHHSPLCAPSVCETFPTRQSICVASVM